MYQAKAGGKGRITVLDQQARAEARDKLRLVAELRDAIERREITLTYQPIFSSVDGHPVAVESLARWTHRRARPDQPGHVRPPGGGERPDRRPRPAGARRDLPPAGRVGPPARPRRAAARQRQRLGAAARRQPGRSGGGRARAAPARPLADLRRDHRVGPDEGPGVGPRRAAAAARPRHRAGDRRLRHRLLVAGLPPAPARRLPQGGPLVRRGDGRRPPRDRLGRHRAGRAPSTSAPSPRGWRRSSRPTSSPASARPTCRASASPNR